MEKLDVINPAIPDFPKAKVLKKEAWETIKWLKPFNEPVWHAVEESEPMQPDDPVLGLYINHRAWAIPWWIMKNHHAANLILDDQPVLIAFCEMCTSATAFDPRSGDKTYTFRVVGGYNGSILISDFETDSLWASFKGECGYGELKGIQLKRIPLYQCFWEQWVKQHPKTLVAYGEQHLRKGHGSRHSPGSKTIGATFAATMLRPMDERLPYYIVVLGVRNEQVTRAYPLLALNSFGSVFHDTLGEEEIVIFHIPGDLQTLAFSRRLNGKVLDFEEPEPGKIKDRNTGSYWNYMGECYAGLLQGQALTFVLSAIDKWFIWAAYYPDTEIFETEQFSRLSYFSSEASF